jgi:RNA polymerase sigma factor (sigma-70 family)
VLSVVNAVCQRHTRHHAIDRQTIMPLSESRFETIIVPHLEAGRRLAHWLMRDGQVADDVVQEASLRAFRYFGTFDGANGRAWFLRIVRNTCYGWRRAPDSATELFDEEQHSYLLAQADPETLLLRTDCAAAMRKAMGSLPDHFHRLLVLRELEGLSYRELADRIGIPIGTVMSRLSRARDSLRGAVGPCGISARHGRLKDMDGGTRSSRPTPCEKIRKVTDATC